MPQDTRQDVIYLREWMKKEPHLAVDFDDQTLTKFLHSCYGSLESTKKCIDRFCCGRVDMSQVFINRDPLLPNLQKAFGMIHMFNYRAGANEYFYYKLIDGSVDKFNFLDFARVFMIIADNWVCTSTFLAEEHTFILDLELITLKLVPKLNISLLRELIVYLLEAIPIRVKNILIVNAPSFYEMLYALVKPILPPEICDIIKFFPGTKGVEAYIDNKYLPKDLGGESSSLKDASNEMFSYIMKKNRKMFLDDKLWKADIKKKPKSKDDKSLLMNGSFRTLSID